MYGNGRRVTSCRIPALSQVLTKSIRSPGLGITKPFAAVAGRLVPASFTTAIETFTRLIVATYGRGFARVRFRVRKNEDRNSHSGSAGLTLRKSHYCASV